MLRRGFCSAWSAVSGVTVPAYVRVASNLFFWLLAIGRVGSGPGLAAKCSTAGGPFSKGATLCAVPPASWAQHGVPGTVRYPALALPEALLARVKMGLAPILQPSCEGPRQQSALVMAAATPPSGLREGMQCQATQSQFTPYAYALPHTPYASPASLGDNLRQHNRNTLDSIIMCACCLIRSPKAQPISFLTADNEIHQWQNIHTVHESPATRGISSKAGLSQRTLQPQQSFTLRTATPRGVASTGTSQPHMAGLMGILNGDSVKKHPRQPPEKLRKPQNHHEDANATPYDPLRPLISLSDAPRVSQTSLPVVKLFQTSEPRKLQNPHNNASTSFQHDPSPLKRDPIFFSFETPGVSSVISLIPEFLRASPARLAESLAQLPNINRPLRPTCVNRVISLMEERLQLALTEIGVTALQRPANHLSPMSSTFPSTQFITITELESPGDTRTPGEPLTRTSEQDSVLKPQLRLAAWINSATWIYTVILSATHRQLLPPPTVSSRNCRQPLPPLANFHRRQFSLPSKTESDARQLQLALTLTDLHLTRALILALLLIGGIEPNPGMKRGASTQEGSNLETERSMTRELEDVSPRTPDPFPLSRGKGGSLYAGTSPSAVHFCVISVICFHRAFPVSISDCEQCVFIYFVRDAGSRRCSLRF